MQSLRQSDANEGPEVKLGSFADVPIELLAKIITFLSPADISRLFQTNKTYYVDMFNRKELVDLLRFFITKSPKTEESNSLIQAHDQINSLPVEKKSLVRVKHFLQKTSVNNLDTTIQAAQKANDFLRTTYAVTGIIKGTVLISCLTFGVVSMISFLAGFEHAILLSFGLGALAAIPLPTIMYIIPRIYQSNAQKRKAQIDQQFNSSLAPDSTTPLLTAFHGNSYTLPTVTSPVIEEVVSDLDETQEVELKEIITDTSLSFPEVPTHPVTRNSSSALFVSEAEDKSDPKEVERKGVFEI